ncbi:MAG: hypothetical protein J7623_04910 [Chitinophaga sp.]|uniref:hypothetical protein n=1 Tax=Chitinophaga sp. TaxID=1869181 RepID=UPI001B169A6B|nr:hypothetical protein [Chitinophaga sp.]MBO9727958.1 hypothetical protein [Chitinophaga sp.]
MKNIVLVLGIAGLMSCRTSIKLAIPEQFKQQAVMQHVDGARGNKMSFANFSTSKIKRGMHISNAPWFWGGNGFFLENLFLQKYGIRKSELVTQEKTKFRYTLSDGRDQVDIYAREKELTKTRGYESINNDNSILNGFSVLMAHQYIFSAMIVADTTRSNNKNWELLMTNIYDREAEHDNNPFTFIKQEDNGLATNGVDTIFIKPLSIKKTSLSNGKTGQLPFKLLSGYELSTHDGVIAIIDLIDRNVWFYNELNATEKLPVSAIATAIFARRVNDAKW